MQNKRIVLLAAVLLGICMGGHTVMALPAAGTSETAAASTAAEDKGFVHTETFSETHSMTGLFSECTEYFSSGNWDIQDSVLHIVYNVTQLRDDHISDFTVSLNGEPFYSQRVTDSKGEMQTSEITIPKEKIKEGVNELKVESYIRTYESMPCADDVSKANWLNISEDSSVSISYIPKVQTGSIANVYEQLTAIDALENVHSALFLPENPTDSELTAAAEIMTGISQNASIDYQNFCLERGTAIQEEDYHYGIYVGELYQLPGDIYDALSEDGRKAASEGAVLAYAKVYGKDLLVLTGSDTELLKKGGVMLGNPDYMDQMTGTSHPVEEGETVNMELSEQEEYLPLTDSGAYINGAFRQSVSFSVASSANKTLSSSSSVYLKVRYSENLDFERSLLTVYVNDIPVGSHKLSKEKANGDEAEFYIPADLEINGDFIVKAAFDLEIEDVWCTLRQEDNPWAYVSEESMMKMVLADDIPLLFDNYPAPFVKNGSMNQVLAVLPEKPSAADLEVLRGVCLTLGRYQKNNSGSIAVAQGAQAGDLKDRNLIVIGTWNENPLVAENNEKLYFKFDQEGILLSNSKMQITREAGSIMGTAQLLPSPYSSDKAALFITGASENGMLSAAKYLSDTDELWKISGDGYVSDTDNMSAYQFTKNKKTVIDTVDNLLDRKDVLMFVTASAVIMGVLLLGLIMVIVKHLRTSSRRKRRQRKLKEGGQDEEA
ncbi:MAG: cellulose biosynthesis cyclic di-GMP-binding regulatory protein BcsB [Eubacteriales bacterium]|nr:cellulose biosynthesis cyclic di-GMP-binding regulatory protein BcsB [Eubacteriales bacterium]